MQTRYRIGVMSEVENRQARTRERWWMWEPSKTECWRNCSHRPSCTYCTMTHLRCLINALRKWTQKLRALDRSGCEHQRSKIIRRIYALWKHVALRRTFFCVATKIPLLLLWCEACVFFCFFFQSKTNALYDTQLQHYAAFFFYLDRRGRVLYDTRLQPYAAFCFFIWKGEERSE